MLLPDHPQSKYFFKTDTSMTWCHASACLRCLGPRAGFFLCQEDSSSGILPVSRCNIEPNLAFMDDFDEHYPSSLMSSDELEAKRIAFSSMSVQDLSIGLTRLSAFFGQKRDMIMSSSGLHDAITCMGSDPEQRPRLSRYWTASRSVRARGRRPSEHSEVACCPKTYVKCWGKSRTSAP